MSMRVGAMRVPFLLQSETLIAGDQGGGSLSQWQTVGSFWGRLDAYTKGYRAALDENITHQVVTRYRSNLAFQLGQRLAFEDRYFIIRFVREVDDRQRLVALYLEEVRYL
ncbi:MAG: head-tail adaptor protein [Bdellovibrionales bacterium]|jgi:head-tail adaptor